MNFYIRFLILFNIAVLGNLSDGIIIKPTLAATQEIVAVVNDEAISALDLNKRMKLIMASSGLPNTKDIRSKLTPQILNGLINEQIMIQEARKLGFEVTNDEIKAGFAKIAAQNKSSPEKFKSMLTRSGIDISSMYAQIKSQIAWSKVVQSKLRAKVIISERDVDDAQERLSSKIGSKEYLIAKIFLPITNNKQQAQVKQLAQRLVREIKSGKASFFKLAQQFSKAAGSANGGDAGWIEESQIPKEILAEIKSINKNQVTKPIKTLDGYNIIFLRDTRTLSEDTMPSRDQIYYSLGNQRLDKLQRSYLNDLRASSFIDIRV